MGTCLTQRERTGKIVRTNIFIILNCLLFRDDYHYRDLSLLFLFRNKNKFDKAVHTHRAHSDWFSR
jgi:hypothetical protein